MSIPNNDYKMKSCIMLKSVSQRVQEGAYNQQNNTKPDGDQNIEHLLSEVSGIRGVLLFHLIVLCPSSDRG